MNPGHISVSYPVTKIIMDSFLYMDFNVADEELAAKLPAQQRIEAVRWLIANMMFPSGSDVYDDGSQLVLTFEFSTWAEAEAHTEDMIYITDIWLMLEHFVPKLDMHWMRCRHHDGPAREVAEAMFEEIATHMTKCGIPFEYEFCDSLDEATNYAVVVQR